MAKKHGFTATKPTSLWNKPLKADFKGFFKALTKAAGNGASGNWGRASSDAVDAFSAVGLGKDCGEVAWLLIQRSLTQAVYTLVEENAELLDRNADNPAVVRRQRGLPIDDPEAITARLDLSLDKSELTIDEAFFKRPKQLPVLEQFKKPFMQWLEIFGLSEAEATSIVSRLPSYFVFALTDQWRTRPSDYECLREAVNTPFTRASEREQLWQQYSAWLQKQVDERMFLEAFSLKQVYVPLRAYYEEKIEIQKSERPPEPQTIEPAKQKRTVIDMEKELEAWLKKNDRDDAVRVISGGPGSGKSSLTKMLAAKLAERGERRVLFVPLHLFELSDDLEDAVKKFVRYDRNLPPNPLDPEDNDSQLLIIFDGLDELAMQGKVAVELAQQFVREVLRKTYQINLSEPRLKVLISGRELVLQANANEFRKPRQILHVLPYLVSKEERHSYSDSRKLLEQDQRQLWWEAYGKASGHGHLGLPQELNRKELVEVTTQPLLNYLVALSFARGRVDLASESNLNVIYEDLLKAVHQRGWAEHQHPAIRDVQEESFIRLLEEIAVAAWHGDGRTTTVAEIEEHCESSGVRSLLSLFQEGASRGVTRLLMAFYFRGAGARSSGDKTFEFTHKSFGEYLTARRIVRVIERTHTELESRSKNVDSGWDEREALTHWIRLCGPAAFDDYLLKFIENEMRLFNRNDVSNWQEMLCRLISFEVRNGMPMERVGARPAFQEETRQACNAEEALLAALNACAQVTERESAVDWPTKVSVSELISRLEGQSSSSRIFNYLSFLNMKGCSLSWKAAFRANFYRSNMEGATLLLTSFYRANFAYANLRQVDLIQSKIDYADFTGANLNAADLSGVSFRGVSLNGADLSEADVSGANLVGADLSDANLRNCRLHGTDLRRVSISGANFEGAQLDDAIFDDASVKRAILRATKGRHQQKRAAVTRKLNPARSKKKVKSSDR